jgi:arylformamidase
MRGRGARERPIMEYKTLTEPDPFRFRGVLPHFETSAAEVKTASASTRARRPCRLDVAYGDGPDETLDLFFPDEPAKAPAPIHLFVHGGYWRANSKNDYSFIADSVCALGAIAAIMDYTLMPAVRMGALVDQTRRAARWLGAHAHEFGGDPDAISASGHSAGGHLVAWLGCRAPHEADLPDTPVRSILAVSGIYDLAPIATSFLQPELHLTAQEIAQWSPCYATPRPDLAIRLILGARETAPFFEHAGRFAGRLASHGARPILASIEGEDHLTIARSLGRVGSVGATHLAKAIAASRPKYKEGPEGPS